MKFHALLFIALLPLVGCSKVPTQGQAAPKDLEALDALRRKDPKTAITELKRYLESKPRDEMAWTMIGHAHESQDQNDEAESAYRKALEINPRRFDALTGLGILCRKKGDYDQALACYQEALTINPNYAQAYSSMTVIALKQGNDAKALEYAKKGYALNMSDPIIAANLAAAYHYNGMLELRDKMTAEAERLGYVKIDVLRKIYSGEISLKDK